MRTILGLELRHTKIYVPYPEYSEFIQQKLFALGVSWPSSSWPSSNNGASFVNAPYLFIDYELKLSYADDKYLFDIDGNKEIIFNEATDRFMLKEQFNLKNTKIKLLGNKHFEQVMNSLYNSEVKQIHKYTKEILSRADYLYIDEYLNVLWSNNERNFIESDSREIELTDSGEFKFMEQNSKTSQFKHFKHLDFLKKYLEIAEISETPWDSFEYFNDISQQWHTLKDGDGFCTDKQYKLKKKTKKINGLDIPDIGITPAINTMYVTPEFNENMYRAHLASADNKLTEFHISNNLCYPESSEGIAAAILHTKALLGCV